MRTGTTVNKEQRLYVYPTGCGYSTKGWDYAHEQAEKVAAWMNKPELIPTARKGTKAHASQCERVMVAGALHSQQTGTRCVADLCPQLSGLEGKRVEVVDRFGTVRRFQVGRSTGWMPIHLEVARRTSSGGCAAYGHPFKSVVVVS